MVEKYFKRTPARHERLAAIRLMRAGTILLIVALTLLLVGSLVLAIVTVILAAGVFLHGRAELLEYLRAHHAAEPKPSDEKMNELLQTSLDAAAERAMKRLDLSPADLALTSEEADPAGATSDTPRLAEQGSGPLTIFGPILDPRKQRVGADRVWRFRSYEVMVICPTKHHLGIYECMLDMRTGTLRNEEVREYYYADVIMVSLVNTPREIALESRNRDGSVTMGFRGIAILDELQIVVASGDRSEIITGITERDTVGRPIRLQESRLDQVVASLRVLLRSKKGQRAS